MRGAASSAIRDNVLFELGLFIGKLGRDRVYFVTPEGVTIHIATDLVGVTPGKYNPNREDKSFQAATGPACNQIRTQIKKLGLLRSQVESEDAGESVIVQSKGEDAWVDDFIKKDYPSAKAKLEIRLSNESGDDALETQVWIAYIDSKINEKVGVNSLLELAEKHKEKREILKLVFRMLSWAGYEEKAITLAEKTLIENASDKELVILISDIHVKLGDSNNAINILNKNTPENDPELSVALIKIYKDNNDVAKATSLANSAYLNTPTNESLMFSFARLLQDQSRHKEAAYLLNTLSGSHPNTVEYWGYLSNSCLALDLYDQAMTACKKAVDLSQHKEGWVLNNVGNMFNNKGFYSEAISWLNDGLAKEPTSTYGHERLSKTIKNKEDEEKKFTDMCRDGRKLIREFQLPSQQEDLT